MRYETIFALSVSCHVLLVRHVRSDCHTSRQQAVVNTYNGTTQEFLIWWGLLQSRVECVHKCYKDSSCTTFQLSQDGTCSMYTSKLDLLKAFVTGNEPGVITIQLKFNSGAFGDDCEADEACHFPNSECRESVCGCVMGYSFNPTINACTNGCTMYGMSYTLFPGTAVYGMKVAEYRDVASVEDCLKLCSSMANCKSFDYLVDFKCYLKWGGGLDSSFFSQVVSVHGVRNCYT